MQMNCMTAIMKLLVLQDFIYNYKLKFFSAIHGLGQKTVPWEASRNSKRVLFRGYLKWMQE